MHKRYIKDKSIYIAIDKESWPWPTDVSEKETQPIKVIIILTQEVVWFYRKCLYTFENNSDKHHQN